VENGDLGGAQHDFDLAMPLAEGAVAKAGATSKARSALALLYSRVGRLHARRAAAIRNASATGDECAEATRWMNQSLAIWRQMESRHELSGANRRRPLEVADEIARCSRPSP